MKKQASCLLSRRVSHMECQPFPPEPCEISMSSMPRKPVRTMLSRAFMSRETDWSRPRCWRAACRCCPNGARISLVVFQGSLLRTRDQRSRQANDGLLGGYPGQTQACRLPPDGYVTTVTADKRPLRCYPLPCLSSAKRQLPSINGREALSATRHVRPHPCLDRRCLT